MSGLGEQALGSFLGDVAAATPAPGGGSSAAVTLALGAALVEMSASLAGEPESAARAGAIRAAALDLAEAELSSYAPVLPTASLLIPSSATWASSDSGIDSPSAGLENRFNREKLPSQARPDTS